MTQLIKIIPITILTVSFTVSEGQQTPFNPVSYRIFSPYIFNPAIVGSKEYSSINLIAAFQQKATSQLLAGDTRLSKRVSRYYLEDSREFLRLGIGGSVFNDLNGYSRNIGASVAAAYHLPLSKKALSFLSFGAAVKAAQNTMDYPDPGDGTPAIPSKKTFFPNVDVGMYYYGTNFYAGVSAANLLGNPEDTDTSGIPVSQQYYLYTGYKLLIQRANGIVLEPSVILSAVDSMFNDIGETIHPLVKLYLREFCLGTYFNNQDTYSFFFQYRYPALYLGAYFEIPKNSAYTVKEPVIEITLGFNLKGKKSGSSGQARW